LFGAVRYFVIFPQKIGLAHFDGTNHMHPPSIYAYLCPGDCIIEDKIVDLEGAPDKLDLIFAIDLTSSMTPILSA